MVTRPLPAGVAPAAIVVALLAACSFASPTLSASTVPVLAPRDHQTVRLPFKVTWARGTAPHYAVFVDQAPILPGQPLTSLVDARCLRTPGCYDTSYLTQRGVYVTSTTSVEIDGVTVLSAHHPRRELHQLFVTPIGPDGRRVGDAAGIVEFYVDRG